MLHIDAFSDADLLKNELLHKMLDAISDTNLLNDGYVKVNTLTLVWHKFAQIKQKNERIDTFSNANLLKY